MSVKNAEFDAYSKPIEKVAKKFIQKVIIIKEYRLFHLLEPVCKSSWPSNYFQVSLFAIF
jgi:hypothetical protein